MIHTVFIASMPLAYTRPLVTKCCCKDIHAYQSDTDFHNGLRVFSTTQKVCNKFLQNFLHDLIV